MTITVDAVSKHYPDGTIAVDGVSFEVEDNSTVVLVGSSGSGKSTLLSLVNRMIDPTVGRVLIDGQDISGVNPACGTPMALRPGSPRLKTAVAH